MNIIQETKLEKEQLQADMHEMRRIHTEEMETVVDFFSKKSIEFIELMKQDGCEQQSLMFK